MKVLLKVTPPKALLWMGLGKDSSFTDTFQA